MRNINMSNARKTGFDERKEEIRRLKRYTYCEPVLIDLSNEDKRDAFIFFIEKQIIRKSYEYKKFMLFLKDNLNLNSCMFFKNVTRDIGIPIIIHHTPFTLYDLVDTALTKFLNNDLAICPYLIADYVMYLHFTGQVGLVPLTNTAHQLVHNNALFIPYHYVYGDVDSYYMENFRDIASATKENLAKLIAMSEELANARPTVLQNKFIYVDQEGVVLPKYIGEDNMCLY